MSQKLIMVEIYVYGSVIGSIIIAIGFYAMMWAQIKENSTTLDVQSTQKTPFLQCRTSGEDV